MANVLVCGTNYGRIYIEALRLAGSKHSLAGILARGSPRSRQVAGNEGVPLYCSVDDLPPDIELACVAVGSSAVDVPLELLKRRIPVLCEHPLKTVEVRRALDLADQHGTVFNINGHFADLETIAPFQQACQRERQTEAVVAVDLVVADRSLYGGLDIVRRSLGSAAPFEFHHAGRASPFEHLAGKLSGCQITISVQTSGVENDSSLADCSPEYLTDVRTTIIFRTGNLALLSIAGPVIWNRNYNRPVAQEDSMYDLLSPVRMSSRDLDRRRVTANLHAINRLADQMQTRRVTPEQKPEHLIEVAQMWEAVGELLKS